jgi:glyoxylase-like metal-dependent hydrolase (beta-lactamase superfamily II)
MEWIVHVLRHPVHGTWIVDTGLPADSPARGIVKSVLKDVVVVETLHDVLARQPAPLAGVALTHMHIDHVFGLPDVPAGTPVHVGPDEQSPRSFENFVLKGTIRRALEGHDALVAWSFGDAEVGGLPAVDVFGDGSLIALYTPGHTPGSTSFLVNTTTGPVLLVGDTSHTRWGWENGVEPGTFTLDHEGNARSLAALKALVETWPDVDVFVGHETDGEGTGIDEPR